MTDEHGTEEPPQRRPREADRLPQVADALAEMSTRLSALADEVRALRAAEPTQREQAPAAVWHLPPQAAQGRQEPPRSRPGSGSGEPGTTKPQPAPKPSLTERLGREGFGSKLLAWVGGGVTIAGVVLLMVLAIERGWIGPTARVLLGAALGVILIVLAIRLHRRPTADGPLPGAGAGQHAAFALAATGFAVVYIDILAATAFLSLLPAWAGLLAGLASALAGLGIAARWHSQRLAVFVLVAIAVCAPVLTEGFSALLLAFLMVLLVATTPVHLTRRWPGALLASGLPPLLAASLACLFHAVEFSPGYPARTVAMLATVSAALVVVLATAATARQHDAGIAASTLLAGAPAPAMLTSLIVDARLSAPLIAALALLALCLWASGSRERLPADLRAVSGGAAAVLVFHATVVGTDGDVRAFAVLGQALLLGVLTARVRRLGTLVAACAYGLLGLVLALVTAVPVRTLVSPSFAALDSPALAVAAAAAALITATTGMLGYAASRVLSGDLQWTVFAPAGIVALYGTTGIIVCLALLVSTDRAGFLAGHALVTVSWTVAALLLLVCGIGRRPLRVSGLVLVGAALAKLVVFDLSSLDGLARVAAFLGAGLVLLAAGVRYARLVAAE